MDTTLLGRVLLVVGLLVAAAGGWLMTGHRLPFGSLPGDLSFNSGNVSVSIPLVSGIILSVILTVVLNIVLRR
jgi:hypothetical protein